MITVKTVNSIKDGDFEIEWVPTPIYILRLWLTRI